nr:MAG TPA: tail collar fiber protein [Caudoviricetes sp.]
MSQINNYPLVVDFENATFVVETESGTRRLNFSQIATFFNDIVNAGGIGEAKSTAAEALQAALSANNTANDAVERIDDVIQKNIATAYIQNRHLYIQLVDDTRVDCGIVIEGKEYGVCYDASTQSPTLERVGDAVGLHAGFAVGSDTNIVNDFDNIYPWSDIKRCTIANDGTITSYQGDANYIEDGSIGQVMVEIPKFYIKRVTDESNQKVYTYIAGEQLSGYRLPEAFKDHNGDEMDYIYLAAYPSVNDGSNLTNSVATKQELNIKEEKYANVMNYALNRGGGWHNFSAAEVCDVIIPLFIVEFATHNSSALFPGNTTKTSVYCFADVESYGADKNEFTTSGVGDFGKTTPFAGKEFFVGMPVEVWLSPNQTDYTLAPMDRIEGEGEDAVTISIRNITHITKDAETGKWTIAFDGAPILIDADFSINSVDFNGVCNNIKASSGVVGDGEEGCVSFKWRGFENLFNYDVVWLGGILYNKGDDGYIHYNPDLTQQNDTGYTEEPFVKTDISVPNATGYIKEMSNSEDYPFLWLPVELDGASDTAYCDKFTKIIITNPTRGIRWGDSGVFGFSSARVSDIVSTITACGRLAYCRF